jgi:hypothetical protein
LTICCVSVPPTSTFVALQIREDGADRSDDVDAGMIVETSILDRDHASMTGLGMLASGTLRRFCPARAPPTSALRANVRDGLVLRIHDLRDRRAGPS